MPHSVILAILPVQPFHSIQPFQESQAFQQSLLHQRVERCQQINVYNFDHFDHSFIILASTDFTAILDINSKKVNCFSTMATSVAIFNPVNPAIALALFTGLLSEIQ